MKNGINEIFFLKIFIFIVKFDLCDMEICVNYESF